MFFHAIFLAYLAAGILVLVPAAFAKGPINTSYFDGMVTGSSITLGFLASVLFLRREDPFWNYVLHLAVPFAYLSVTVLAAYMLSLGFTGQNYQILPLAFATLTFLTSLFSVLIYIVRMSIRATFHVAV